MDPPKGGSRLGYLTVVQEACLLQRRGYNEDRGGVWPEIFKVQNDDFVDRIGCFVLKFSSGDPFSSSLCALGQFKAIRRLGAQSKFALHTIVTLRWQKGQKKGKKRAKNRERLKESNTCALGQFKAIRRLWAQSKFALHTIVTLRWQKGQKKGKKRAKNRERLKESNTSLLALKNN